jgi:uncharacterized phage protein (TIGR01671 family)
MREIKFRTWRPIEMDPELGFTMDYDPIANSYEPVHLNDELVDNPEEEGVFMQFTGLHDKDGREIYEGDIVRVGDGEFDVLWCNGGFKLMERKSAISGAIDMWMAELFGTCQCRADRNDAIEVIGNDYENPEPLEQK